MPIQPPRWSDEELQADRNLAEQRFIAERRGEGPAAYDKAWDKAEAEIRAAFEATANLRDIAGADLSGPGRLWQTLRYVCGPRISEEDLWTLVGKKFKRVPQAYAAATAAAFSDLVDQKRHPWIAMSRDPTQREIDAAILATATLLAHEALGTARRGSASKIQEDMVSEALSAAQWRLDKSRSQISALDELSRGTFSRERKVGGAKCDIPVRLRDGRLLALECKVSNGPKNSWKRLQREVGGKSETWRRAYGSQVVTGAVLAGVFDLKCLSDAQNKQNVLLFWQHDLSPLIDFVRQCSPPLRG